MAYRRTVLTKRDRRKNKRMKRRCKKKPWNKKCRQALKDKSEKEGQ